MKNFLFSLMISSLVLLGCSNEGLLRIEDEAPASSSAANLAASPITFPDILPLPNGFKPEGIVIGKGKTFYAGSLGSGALYRGNVGTGDGEVFVAGQPGAQSAVGLSYDRRTDYVYVAGGFFGTLRVYDGNTGHEAAAYRLNDAPFGTTFVNDVIVTKDAAYLTDSFRAVFYKVPLAPNGGLPSAGDVQEIPLSGDFTPGPGFPAGFDSNGIVASRDGRHLIVVHVDLGVLYRVDPDTGEAHEIDLGGASVQFGDGLLLEGHTLYVVQNFLNQVAEIRLNADFSRGEVTNVISDDAFRIPTTLDSFGNSLYVVNARFDVAPPGEDTPDVEFEVVRVDK